MGVQKIRGISQQGGTIAPIALPVDPPLFHTRTHAAQLVQQHVSQRMWRWTTFSAISWYRSFSLVASACHQSAVICRTVCLSQLGCWRSTTARCFLLNTVNAVILARRRQWAYSEQRALISLISSPHLNWSYYPCQRQLMRRSGAGWAVVSSCDFVRVLLSVCVCPHCKTRLCYGRGTARAAWRACH